MLRIGLLGAGRIGHVHAMTLAGVDGAELVAVSDAIPHAAESLAERYKARAMTSDALIASPDVDAVAICTPTTTHFDMIHQAAAAGKAIFCEKPIDLSTERTRTCLATVEAAGVPFMTAFNRRFDPNFSHLQEQLRAGAIGTIEMVTLLSRDPSPPPISYVEASGGLFRDMMVHDFDMARFLLAEEPVEVHAMASCLVDPAIGEAGDVDTAMVTLRTASGKLCQISNSRRATYGYDQRVEVHGSKGLLKADNMFAHSVTLANGTGFQSAPTEPFFLERYARAYALEMTHFVEALKAGQTPQPSGQDGLRAQMLADAAQQSLDSGQPVVLASA